MAAVTVVVVFLFSVVPIFQHHSTILALPSNVKRIPVFINNRPFSFSTKEPGSSIIFIHFYTRGSIE